MSAQDEGRETKTKEHEQEVLSKQAKAGANAKAQRNVHIFTHRFVLFRHLSRRLFHGTGELGALVGQGLGVLLLLFQRPHQLGPAVQTLHPPKHRLVPPGAQHLEAQAPVLEAAVLRQETLVVHLYSTRIK